MDHLPSDWKIVQPEQHFNADSTVRPIHYVRAADAALDLHRYLERPENGERFIDIVKQLAGDGTLAEEEISRTIEVTFLKERELCDVFRLEMTRRNGEKLRVNVYKQTGDVDAFTGMIARTNAALRQGDSAPLTVGAPLPCADGKMAYFVQDVTGR